MHMAQNSAKDSRGGDAQSGLNMVCFLIPATGGRMSICALIDPQTSREEVKASPSSLSLSSHLLLCDWPGGVLSEYAAPVESRPWSPAP
ncbi:hypothetical protein SKAU_G00080430 [Synaphobranchus kaupii]|uniref:Uncharacterized protein n=1 Tax=Synaphobranchus kaupii TaxID=118154 RepID=A0A9Q1FUR1_SYNKA|nr:hypothetical protein SKAU_G00080430 [Synaphobranchus kaupii]